MLRVCVIGALVFCHSAVLAIDREIVLPSESCRGMFIVPLDIDGARFDLLLDTGSSWTFVDPEVVRRVRQTRLRRGRLDLDAAQVGGFALPPTRARIAPMRRLSLALGRDIDGILGFPAFRDVLLTLDYPAGEVRVSPGSLPPVDGRTVFRDAGRRRPALTADLGGSKLKLLIDSGSTGRFAVKPRDRLSWVSPSRPVRTVTRFDSVDVERAGRMRGSIEFGPARFEDPIVIESSDERQAGWHVLRHFALTFDQRHRRIGMARAGDEPIRMAPWTGDGLSFVATERGWRVLDVFAGTPAERAGVRSGDLITAVDGRPVVERGCAPASGRPSGSSRTLTVERDARSFEATLTTVELIR